MGCISTGRTEMERWCHLPSEITLPNVLECSPSVVDPIVNCSSEVSLEWREKKLREVLLRSRHTLYIHMYTNMELIKLVNYSVARLKAKIFH